MPKQQPPILLHHENITSDPTIISSSFTTSLGAGYKNYDNPQIAFSLKFNEQFNNMISPSSLFSAVKITFELRRNLPLTSPHHSESLGFCIVSSSSWINSPLELLSMKNANNNNDFRVVAESEFVPSDCVVLSVNASQLLLLSKQQQQQNEGNTYNNFIVLFICKT